MYVVVNTSNIKDRTKICPELPTEAHYTMGMASANESLTVRQKTNAGRHDMMIGRNPSLSAVHRMAVHEGVH